MSAAEPNSRRTFIVHSSALGAGLAISALSPAYAAGAEKPEKKEEEVSPPEDLMREHGVLNRILLIYDEHVRRLEAKQQFDPAILASAAGIIRHFVEEYHEKLEEDFLFPRFRNAHKLVDLVDTLLAQHQAGRRVTAQIEQPAVAGTLKDESKSRQLGDSLRAFVRMYGRTRLARTRFCSRRFAESYRSTNLTRSEKTSKRKKISCSGTKGSSRSWIRSQSSKRNWESTS